MTCKKCGGKGFVYDVRDGYDFVVKCDCQSSQDVKHQLREAGIPHRFWYGTLRPGSKSRKSFMPGGGSLKLVDKGIKESFRHNFVSQKQALDKCLNLLNQYVDRFVHKKDVETPGLLMFGSCGLGKTHLLATLLTDLVYEGLTQVRFCDYSGLMRQIRYSYSQQNVQESSILAPLIRSKVLVLDDLGGETTENLSWLQDVLGFILTERQNRSLPTLISTNYPDDEDLKETQRAVICLSDRIGTRLRSRLFELCPKMRMRGMDLRPLFNGSP